MIFDCGLSYRHPERICKIAVFRCFSTNWQLFRLWSKHSIQ